MVKNDKRKVFNTFCKSYFGRVLKPGDKIISGCETSLLKPSRETVEEIKLNEGCCGVLVRHTGGGWAHHSKTYLKKLKYKLVNK